VLIGALTLGSALPHLIDGLGDLPWRAVMATAAACGAVGALIAATLVRSGPYLAGPAPPPHPRYALTMFAERAPRLVNLGYFGHMWELYALWTWLPSFLLAGAVSRSSSTTGSSIGLLTFVSIGLAGVIGCLLGGWAADRFGRSRAAVTALVVSGSCCLLSPLFFGAGPAALLAFSAIWGAAVIADSGVFSTSLSEVADRAYVGTALTAQTAIGFALTVVTIQLVPVLADAVGWQWAFWLLAPGPIVGAIAMRAFGHRAVS
jgi:MFS family permease